MPGNIQIPLKELEKIVNHIGDQSRLASTVLKYLKDTYQVDITEQLDALHTINNKLVILQHLNTKVTPNKET